MGEPNGGAQRGPGSSRGDDHVHDLSFNMTAGLEDKLRDHGGGHGGRVEVRTALEAMGGVGVQAVAFAATAHGGGIKPGGFNQDIFGFGGDHRVPAAHDAGQPDGLFFVGNDQVL